MQTCLLFSVTIRQCTEVADLVLFTLPLIIVIITNILSVTLLSFPTCHKFVAWSLNLMKHNIIITLVNVSWHAVKQNNFALNEKQVHPFLTLPST